MRNRLFGYVPAAALCCLSFEHANPGFANPAAPDPGGQLTKLQARADELERRIGKAEKYFSAFISPNDIGKPPALPGDSKSLTAPYFETLRNAEKSADKRRFVRRGSEAPHRLLPA